MYAVRFPDMPSVMTFAFSRSHALEMAFESNGVLKGEGAAEEQGGGTSTARSEDRGAADFLF